MKSSKKVQQELFTRKKSIETGQKKLETRSGTEKRCSHNLQSGHPAWSADNYGIFPTVNILRLFGSKKRRTDGGNHNA